MIAPGNSPGLVPWPRSLDKLVQFVAAHADASALQTVVDLDALAVALTCAVSVQVGHFIVCSWWGFTRSNCCRRAA